MKIKVVITDQKIEKEALLELSHQEIGAVVEFWGVVRQMEKGKAIEGLHYEAYSSMAEKKMRQILEELNECHACELAFVIHRVGWVPVGEPSLYIRVDSRHRKEAFLLCHQFIDRLKEDVPIWKEVEVVS